MQHSHPLLQYHARSGISLDQWLVAHVESSHELQDWDLDWEVEWSDNTNRSERPSVASVELSDMISWLSLTVRQESNSVTTEVLIEVQCYLELTEGLLSALGNASLDALDEELHDFLVVEAFNDTPVDLTEHQVSLLVLEWVVGSPLGALLQTLNKWTDLIHLSIWLLHHGLTGEWVYEVHIVGSGGPLSLDQVVALVLFAEVVGVDGGEGLEVGRHGSG